MRPWVAARSRTYKWFTAVTKCTTIIPPGSHLEQKASLGNFCHHEENQELTGNRFCITSPETDFSVIAEVNQPNASISDVTLSYSSRSLNFPAPIHFLHHSMGTTTGS